MLSLVLMATIWEGTVCIKLCQASSAAFMTWGFSLDLEPLTETKCILGFANGYYVQ